MKKEKKAQNSASKESLALPGVLKIETAKTTKKKK